MTNKVLKGYVIKALSNLKYTKEEIQRIENELDNVTDEMTETEAEQFYMHPQK
jgi:hypothetical protein